MNSMTGFGKGSYSLQNNTITIEIKTVNHRYLDYNLKMPHDFLFLEDSIKKTISSKISRGHIDLFLRYENLSQLSNQFIPNIELAKSYVKVANELAKELGMENDLTFSQVLRTPDVLERSQEEDEEELKVIVDNALVQALDNLVKMRSIEGDHIKLDFIEKLDTIQKSLDKIKTFAPQVTENYRKQLNARIEDMISPELVDKQRLATEIALFADHCAIDEEIQRLSTHIKNMRKLLEDKEPIGRKLDFLVQEMNRETNTIGSKANDLNITTEVLSIKNEIEKIREQACNVE